MQHQTPSMPIPVHSYWLALAVSKIFSAPQRSLLRPLGSELAVVQDRTLKVHFTSLGNRASTAAGG
jgi:hypothetical protein